MNRTVLVVCLLMVSFATIEAQELKRKSIGTKYGYVDEKGKTIIDPEYDDAALSFSEELACVKVKGKWGFINKAGKKVIPCKYEDVWYFHEGLAKAKLDGKWGYIDNKGKEAIPFFYETAGNFENGRSVVKSNGNYGIIDRSGKELVPFKYERLIVFESGVVQAKLNGKLGLLDKTGKEIIPCLYEEVWNYNEGLTRAKLNNKWGYLDVTGKEILPFVYDDASDFSDGEAKVKLNGREFYISKTGDETRADFTKIEKVFSPRDGMQLAMNMSSRKYGYLNEKGKILIPFIYESASLFGNNRAPVTLNGRKTYIDRSGKHVINADQYKYTQTFSQGFAVVQNAQGLYSFIDTAGKLMTDFIYTDANGFGEGLAYVKKDGKYGYLGLDFKLAIPLIYKRASYFSESGLAHVTTMEGKHGYINPKGEYVIPAIYDEGTDNWNMISNNPNSEWPFHTYMVALNGEKKYFYLTGGEARPKKTETTSKIEPKKEPGPKIVSTKTEPAVELKTKFHTLNVYSGWANIFGNTTSTTQYLTSGIGLKISDLFLEAPKGWINTVSLTDGFYGTIRLSFDDSESETTIAKQKQSFIDWCAWIAGLAKDKVKYLNEEVILADGRKGTLLFYYTNRTQNVGFILNCQVLSVSTVNPKLVSIYRCHMEGESSQTLAEKDFPVWKEYFKKILLTVKPGSN